jgi:hypothetical protein
MDAGIALENGSPQNLTFQVLPGEVFVVPKNTLHYNHNAQCKPNVFLQTFTSSDPGAINMVAALSAMGDAEEAGTAAIEASGANGIIPSPLVTFALDQACLKRCQFPAEGAPNGGLDDLPDTIKALFGLAQIPQEGGGSGSSFAPRGAAQSVVAAFVMLMTCLVFVL